MKELEADRGVPAEYRGVKLDEDERRMADDDVPEEYRQKACWGFVGAISEAAYNVADSIAEGLEAEQ